MRGEIENHVVLMPIRVKTQWEDGKLVAMIPAWQLPDDMLVTGANMKDALGKLERRMHQHWGTPSCQTTTTDRSN